MVWVKTGGFLPTERADTLACAACLYSRDRLGGSASNYDKSSKWLIQHHGDSMLRLARVEKIESWRPAQAEVVQPRQLPDGLLEVRLQGETRDDLFLIEVATYPERRVGKQLTGDLMLVYLDRGELPEAVTLVLRPKGKYRIPRSRNLRSRHGLSSCRLKWRVVELWTIPAAELCWRPATWA
jgi:hypothetical protein